jgi:type IV pilus assembly protein PilV
MRRQRGFSMVESMVALIVLSIGLLGVAKVQVLAMASSGFAAKRSLAAIEATSLSASMHANRAYWAAYVAPASFTVNGTTISDPGLAAVTAGCSGGTQCTAAQMAAYDTQQWAVQMNAVLPNPFATVTCSNVANTPVSCTINISWAENQIAINTQGMVAMAGPSYTLFTEP